ncbi:hypothetical protein J6590_101828 [Homalodisca vitripennis]|nr:hypothetical protein J6590_101828 [Homalodisca vitripennis]
MLATLTYEGLDVTVCGTSQTAFNVCKLDVVTGLLRDIIYLLTDPVVYVVTLTGTNSSAVEDNNRWSGWSSLSVKAVASLNMEKYFLLLELTGACWNRAVQYLFKSGMPDSKLTLPPYMDFTHSEN